MRGADLTAVGIVGASAGLAPAIERYADGRVGPSGLVSVTEPRIPVGSSTH